MSRFIVALCVVLLAMPVANLHAEEVASTSRSAGLANAMTAGSAGTAALWHNPAGIVSAMMYSAEAGYNYDNASEISGISANIIDTKSNPYVGTAAAFTYETANPKEGPSHTAYHVRGGLAMPLVDGMVRVGGSVRYSAVDKDDEEVLAALMVDAGILVQPLEFLSIGASFLNLVNGGYDEEYPKQVAVGLALSSLGYGLMLSGDLVFDLSEETPEEARTWRTGLEYLVDGVFPLRLGYSYNETLAEQWITAGAGFRDGKSSIGFDASYQHNLDNDAERVFSGALSVYF